MIRPLLNRLLAPMLVLLACMVPAPVAAAVTITFYARELGSSFPHAFFVVQGTRDDNGTPVNDSYGYTANSITPAILWGPVPGRVEPVTEDYLRSSNAWFSVRLNDAQYDSILALARDWNVKPNSVYRLNTHNCVHFAGEAAARAGLTVTFDRRLMKKPRSFLLAVKAANPGRLTEPVPVAALPAR